jgi:signal transduction histidine kinase/ActR/RegA family two-component response regulator
MDQATETAGDLRVLVLAPTARDAATTLQLLHGASVDACACETLPQLCAEAENGAAALLVTEEALAPPGGEPVRQLVSRQPAWSDLPLLVLTRNTASARLVDFELFGNVTLLDRPVRVSTLVSAVKTAIRSRERQYQLREHLHEQERAREALRDADRRKDEFLAMLAHELRNPLAAIVAASAVLRQLDAVSPVVRRQQEVIDRQSRHTARLIDDLLDVSRITRGRIELRKQPLEVGDALAQIVESCRTAAISRGQTLLLTLPPEPVYIHADVARFEQVVTNLLTNASKYTGNGGTIQVTLRCVNGPGGRSDVELSVRDTGAGISAELLPRVFDLFIQAERTLARSEGGLGIGLTMVRRLVEMHAGKVEAHSDGLGRGSEFVVRLPAIAAPAALASRHARQRAHAEAPDRATKRVMIVEDNQDAAQSMSELLELWGHQVCHASDGESALRLVASVEPDVVLLDIGLPGIDGYEVAERMRQSGLLRGATLIALTGYGREEDRRRAGDAGFDQHLTKPLDPDLLRSVIADAPASH